MKYSATLTAAAVMVVAATTTVATTVATTSTLDRNTASGVRGGVPVPSVPVPVPVRNRRRRKLEDKFSCVLYEKDTQYENHQDDTANWACEMADGQFIDIDPSSSATEFLYREGATSGASMMKVTKGPMYLEQDLTTRTQMIQTSIDTVVSIESLHEDDERHYKSRRKQRQLTQHHQHSQGQRLLADSFGTLDTLVIRVIADNNSQISASANQLKSDIFTDAFCLKTGYAQCSKDQLIINPAPNVGDGGIVDVKISSNPSDGNDSTLREQAVSKATQQYGTLHSKFDLVMMCLPPGTGGWVAYAYINSYLSVYNNDWCQQVSAQMHEVGHNLGLGHSNEGEQAYGDQSSMMGYSYKSDDGPKMCFNAAKNYQLGWYERQKLSFDPLANKNTAVQFTLNGIVDYNKNSQQATQTNGIPLVSIRLKQYGDSNGIDYYIGYNRKTGVNDGTMEAADAVTIIRKDSGYPMTYGESNRLAALGSGQQFVINNFKNTQVDVTISVKSISTNKKDAIIEICYGTCNSPPPCNGNGNALVVEVVTDQYTEETSWSLKKNINNGVGLGNINGIGGNNLIGNTQYTYEPYCVDNNQRYTMVVSDSFGDGQGNTGSFKGYLDGVVVFESLPGSWTGTQTSKTFCVGNCDTPVPTKAPTQAPTPGFINVATDAPTSSKPACENLSGYKWQGKKRKGCKWVGKGKRKNIRRKCKRKEKNLPGLGRIRDYCQAVCAEVGNGPNTCT